jgi:hypothetical protein
MRSSRSLSRGSATVLRSTCRRICEHAAGRATRSFFLSPGGVSPLETGRELWRLALTAKPSPGHLYQQTTRYPPGRARTRPPLATNGTFSVVAQR